MAHCAWPAGDARWTHRQGAWKRLPYMRPEIAHPAQDGFPLSDVQLVISTREARNKLAGTNSSRINQQHARSVWRHERQLTKLLAVLQTDHKALMTKIEESLQKLHAQAKAAKQAAPVRSSSQS